MITLAALTNTIAHFILDGFEDEEPEFGTQIPTFYHNFFISYYRPRSHRIWLITNILSVIMWFSFG